MDFSREDPGVTFEIIRTLGKELKEVREHVRELESGTRASSSRNEIVDSKGPTDNAFREMKHERDSLIEEAWKLKLKISNMQIEIDTMNAVKREAQEGRLRFSANVFGSDDAIPGLTLGREKAHGADPTALMVIIKEGEEKLKELENAIANLQYENETLKGAMETLESRVKALNETNIAIRMENESLRRMNEWRGDEIKDVGYERDTMKRLLENMQRRLEGSDQEITNLKAEKSSGSYPSSKRNKKIRLADDTKRKGTRLE